MPACHPEERQRLGRRIYSGRATKLAPTPETQRIEAYLQQIADSLGKYAHRQLPDRAAELLHMVFLIYSCDVTPPAAGPTILLNEEFDAYAWADPATLREYDLNAATIDTFREVGLLTL